jgi:transcription antitermination factor NusG
VLTTAGVISFVKPSQEVEAIREKEIELLKSLYENGHAFEVNRKIYKKGKEVKINYGSFKNIKGKIVSVLPKKIIIELDVLEENYTLIIPSHYAEIAD